MVVSCLFQDFLGGAWLSIGVLVLLENMHFVIVVSCSFHFFKRRWFCRFATSTNVTSCHTWLSIRVFVLLEIVCFMMVSCSFQVLCKGGDCQFIGDLPLPLVQGTTP